MNIPKPETGLLAAVGLADISVSEVVAHVAVDAIVAASYLLLLLTIVHLNRQKHIVLILPRKTGLYVFLAVLAVTVSATLGSLAMPADWVLLAYKIAIAALILAIIVGVLRLIPRDVDPSERARLSRENLLLRDSEQRRRVAEGRIVRLEADLDSLVAERTTELRSHKLALEKDLLEQRLYYERSQDALRRLEELIQRTGTALAVIDADGNLVEANLALAQFLGRGSESEIVGRSLSRLLGLKDGTELQQFLQEAMRQGTYSTEIDASPPDRGNVAFEASGMTTIVKGRTCVTAMIWDITDRRMAEREVLESREAMSAALAVTRRANAIRSDFLAKMNHELRTPLNGIIGLSEIIRHKASGKTMPALEARKLAKNIHESGRHLLSVVDDLLDLSRLDTGARALNPVPVNVRAEIDAALATLSTIAQKKRIELENACPPELDWTVDQRAFKQVLINLVNNAVKFSPPGRKVWVEVSHSRDTLAMHVRDQGPGITLADRNRILEPFGRGEHATNNKIDGVGLGLAIVSELMKLQGGRIEIDSKPGDGATFTAVFPQGDEAKTPGEVGL